MKQGLRIKDWRTAALAAALALSAAAPVAAQQNSPLSRDDPFAALVGKRSAAAQRPAANAVDRYVVATDNRVFLFQPEGREARMKFLCGAGDPRIDCLIDHETPAEEIYVLTPTRASRGDIVYRDGQGEARLRIASYGGATVFWPGDDRGHAAARSYGEDPPLILVPAGVDTALARARRATALLSALAGAPIDFDIGEPAPGADASVLADAVARAAKGMGRVAQDPIGARVIAARISRVRFERADAPRLRLDDRTLVVGYRPDGDLAGRPSSAAVASFLEDSL